MALEFSLSGKVEVKNDELKQRLLESLRSEKVNFLEIANEFYGQDRRTEHSYIEFCEAVISAVDGVLEAGDWEDSLFLRNTVKPLRAIREEATDLLEELKGTVENSIAFDAPELTEDKQLVYLSVFQSCGQDLNQWAVQLRSIDRHMVGRPVYESEEAVEKVIRSKMSQLSEGYVIAAVKKTAVTHQEFGLPREDRFGNKLITLATGSVTVDDIVEFVHMGRRYGFVKGKLIEKVLEE